MNIGKAYRRAQLCFIGQLLWAENKMCLWNTTTVDTKSDWIFSLAAIQATTLVFIFLLKFRRKWCSDCRTIKSDTVKQISRQGWPDWPSLTWTSNTFSAYIFSGCTEVKVVSNKCDNLCWTWILENSKWFQSLNTAWLHFKNWMLILVLLCENERQRWDASRYIKARSEAQTLFTLWSQCRLVSAQLMTFIVVVVRVQRQRFMI